jgi:hypothetical protein
MKETNMNERGILEIAKATGQAAVCPVKRFAPELIRVYARRILERLAWTSVGELGEITVSREFLVCVRLFTGAILHDLDSGRDDVLNHPEFRAVCHMKEGGTAHYPGLRMRRSYD